jgi:tRNA acetyltransferase TAN1
MESMNSKKRKSKGKWFGNAKKARYSMCPGQRGFLIFCNNREKEAIREAKILFEEFEPRYEARNTVADDNDDNSSNGEECDVFDELEKEKQKLKEMSSDSADGEKFKLIQTNVQNVLFFKTKLKDPVDFALSILDEIKSTGQQRTRFLLRLIPVEDTCKPFEANVKESAKKILAKHFTNGAASKSYSILFKARCNQEFVKEEAIKIIGGVVREMCPEAKVEYKNPDLVIMVEVIKGNCCLGVLPNYFGYKKYNLIELASNKVDQNKPATLSETTAVEIDTKSQTEVSEPKAVEIDTKSQTKVSEPTTVEIDTKSQTEVTAEDTKATNLPTEVTSEEIDTKTTQDAVVATENVQEVTTVVT